MSSSTNDYCGQHDTSYYQPQPPDDYNQRQQYLHHITKQQASYITDYDKGKVDKCGCTNSGIPSPDINQLPIIPLINVPKYS